MSLIYTLAMSKLCDCAFVIEVHMKKLQNHKYFHQFVSRVSLQAFGSIITVVFAFIKMLVAGVAQKVQA